MLDPDFRCFSDPHPYLWYYLWTNLYPTSLNLSNQIRSCKRYNNYSSIIHNLLSRYDSILFYSFVSLCVTSRVADYPRSGPDPKNPSPFQNNWEKVNKSLLLFFFKCRIRPKHPVTDLQLWLLSLQMKR